MNIFNYHPVTKEFVTAGVADASPLSPGEILLPANATTLQPPSATANQKAIYGNGSWSLTDDYRGSDYWLPDGSYHIVSELGPLPSNALLDIPEFYEIKFSDGTYVGIVTDHATTVLKTTLPPPSAGANQIAVFSEGAWNLVADYRGTCWDKATGNPVNVTVIGDLPPELTHIEKPGDYYAWNGVSWAFDITAMKLAKSNELKLDATNAIISGVSSNALGAQHSYPTNQTDQLNITGLITESLLPNAIDSYLFWCADAGGVWARRSHTKLQIQSVGRVIANHVKTQQAHYESKLIELSVAANEAAIAAITW